MKSMRLPLVAIFFMTYFHRAGGGMVPSAPLDPLLSLFKSLVLLGSLVTLMNFTRQKEKVLHKDI